MITVEQAVQAAQEFLSGIGYRGTTVRPYGQETPDVYLLAREPQPDDDTLLVVEKRTGLVKLASRPLDGAVLWPDAVSFGKDPDSILP